MAAAELRMPADIFDEMAGVREVIPARSGISEANVNFETQQTPVIEERLFSAADSLFAKADDFKKYMLKLFKQFQDQRDEEEIAKELKKRAAKKAAKKAAQKFIPPWILFWIKLAEFVINKWPEIRDSIVGAFMSIIGIIQFIFELIWEGVKWLFGKLWDIIKWVGKKLWEFAKWLGKKIWQVTKWLLKKVGQLLKWLGKMLWKLTKLIMKGIKKVACALWNVISRFFHKTRDKVMNKFFPKQPKAMDMAAKPMDSPTIQMPSGEYEFEEPAERANQMPIKEVPNKPMKDKALFDTKCYKAPGKGKESVFWFLIKKVLKKFADFIKKMVMKIFKPLINKLVDIVVKTIVQFIVNLALSAWALAAAPAVAMGLTIAGWIMRGIGFITFVSGLADVFSEMDDGAMDSYVDDTDDGSGSDSDDSVEREGEARKAATLADWKRKLDELEANKLENTAAYAEVKRNYIVGLIEQAEQTGNIEEAKRLRAALSLPETGGFDIYQISTASIGAFDLEKHLEEEAKRTEEKIKRYNKEAQEDVIAKDELEELLVAANGEPEWMVIVRRLIIGLKERLLKIFDKKIYKDSLLEAMGQVGKLPPLDFRFKSKWIQTRKQRAELMTDAMEHIFSLFDGFYNIFDNIRERASGLFGLFEEEKEDEKPKTLLEAMRDVGVIFQKFSISFTDSTKKFRDTNDRLNEKQHERFLHWLDILILLKTKQIETKQTS